MVNLAPHNPYGLELSGPIMVAAGCWGYGAEYVRLANPTALGAIVTSSTSLRPRRPAALPRIVETPGGLLWAGGTPNPGIEAVLRRYGEFWAATPTPILLSITGSSPDDYADLAAGLEGVEGSEGIAGLELCLPVDEHHAPAIVQQVRAATMLPLLVKLPPRPNGLVELARAVAAAGADALVLPGAVPGAMPDAEARLRGGWLCGPAVRPLALWQLSLVADKLDIPIVAGGGVTSAADARALLALGASAVQIGSAAMVDPSLPGRIAAELSA
jgi:dihydroorotate dehydrogenase (NAD+) catalytic subunit